MSTRQLIAGNWKMNGLAAAVAEARTLADAGRAGKWSADVLICPPFTLIHAAVEACKGSPVAVGAQNCHAEPGGAFTGEVCAEMIADLGARWVIVGHSERRAIGETDADVRAKAMAGRRAGLSVIVCVGETLAERDADKAIEVTRSQVRGSLPRDGTGQGELAVAYEPVWAIGTGRTASAKDIAEMHAAIRAEASDVLGVAAGRSLRILYGGSVKPSNSAEILAVEGVDGALVGGASLKAKDFLDIIKSAASS